MKLALRQELRRRRIAIPQPARNRAAICAARKLAHHTWFRNARHLGIYLPAGSELSTWPLIVAAWASGRKTYVPRIGQHGQMQFVALRPGSPMRPNRHGIAEPCTRTRRPPRQLDLLVIPLLGFAADGRRLGAGGGYYDRLLARCSRHHPHRIGYGFAAQQCEQIPTEDWDQRLHGVVTECRLLRCR